MALTLTDGFLCRPGHFITGSSLGPFSVFKNLLIKNAPSHVFSLSTHTNFLVRSIVIDMKDGYKLVPPGIPAGHNTDGFDSSSGTNTLFTNSVVWNQDDCKLFHHANLRSTNASYRRCHYKCLSRRFQQHVLQWWAWPQHWERWRQVQQYGWSNVSCLVTVADNLNQVEGVTFSNSVILNSENGPRIKTNSGTTGSINNVKYENIAVSNISM